MKITRKKGDATDMMIVVIGIFFLAVIFLVYWYFTTTTAAAFRNTPIYINETSAGLQALQDLGEKGSSQGFVMIMGALILGTIISSFLVRIHPVFIFIYLIMLLMNIIIAVFLGNAYGMLVSQEPFASGAIANPVIDVVMRNIVKIALGVGVLSMIVVFAKLFGGETQI